MCSFNTNRCAVYFYVFMLAVKHTNVFYVFMQLAKTQEGKSALLAAVENENVDCARVLLEVGAETDAKGEVRHTLINTQTLARSFCGLVQIFDF